MVFWMTRVSFSTDPISVQGLAVFGLHSFPVSAMTLRAKLPINFPSFLLARSGIAVSCRKTDGENS
jgi:hypothetical protein